MNEVKRNYIYNLVYYFTNILTSVILLPYVSRVLGSEGIGIYSYTHSIVVYFALFSMLGINNYGNRLIASSRNDKEKMSRNFLGLYTVQFFCSLIVIFFYLIFIIFFCNYDKIIALIQMFYLVSAMLNVNWFFYGTEKFKLVTLTNLISKILSFVSILLFVKDYGDTTIYIIIMGASAVISNLLLFHSLKQNVKFIKISIKDIIKHIKPCLFLFIPEIAVSIYTILNKVMLGSISGVIELGYYEQAIKIINIPLCIIEALSLTILPKMSNLISNSKNGKVKSYIQDSMQFIMFLIVPIVFGLIFVSKDFVLVFLGQDFLKTGVLLIGLSFSILFVAWGSILRNNYIIPNKKDKIFVLSVCSAAFINIISNIILIPKYASVGAVISTVISEFTVVLVQTVALRKELNIKQYFKLINPIIIKTIIVMLIINILNYLHFNSLILKLCFQIICAVILYLTLNVKYMKSLFSDIKILKKFVNAIKKDKNVK